MRLAVVGGDAAGMTAAMQARRRRDPDDLEIVAFERGHFASYSACGIPYWVGGAVTERDALIARSPAAFAEAGISLRLGHEVVGIDLDRRSLTVVHDGAEIHEPFDLLVYATGAVPVKPPFLDDDLGGVFGVQTLDDGTAIQEWLDAAHPRTAAVVGGGYIGLEMAEALVRRGLDVTVLERGDEPMSTVDPDMGSRVREALTKMGITVRTRTEVTGLEGRDGRVRAVTTPEGPVAADVVILGLGVRPNTELAADAGLPIGPTGGIRTDLRMRVAGVEGVWAAGDCVETTHRLTKQPVHVALGTHANKQGRVAGINIGGGYATFPGVIGTAVTKVCELEIARTGLSEREATAAGYAYVTGTIESTNSAGYYPGADTMVVKLIAERRTGALLGAQIVGHAEAAKRIDVLAVAAWNGMTVEEMTALDLGYAPPFSPVWDPVLVAARKTTDALHAVDQ